jgi:hypothetical protein
MAAKNTAPQNRLEDQEEDGAISEVACWSVHSTSSLTTGASDGFLRTR